jgi:hypothetical protein
MNFVSGRINSLNCTQSADKRDLLVLIDEVKRLKVERSMVIGKDSPEHVDRCIPRSSICIPNQEVGRTMIFLSSPHTPSRVRLPEEVCVRAALSKP